MADRSALILAALVATSFFSASFGWAARETQQSSTAPSKQSKKNYDIERAPIRITRSECNCLRPATFVRHIVQVKNLG
jgi:hypothetical protein